MKFTRDDLYNVIRTFVITFVVTVGPGFMGWIKDLTQWANTSGQAPFPDGRNLSFILISGLLAALVAAGAALLRLVENAVGKGLLREVPPREAK